MENSNSFKWSKRPWLYFLFYWVVPIYVTERLFGCVEYARRVFAQWENPITERVLNCVGFRPGGEPGQDFDSVDMMELVLKAVRHD